MASGVLQFSLGLTAGGFVSALGQADSKLKGFLGSALKMPGLGVAIGGVVGSFASLHAVVEGVMGAIEKGSALEKLSRQTGESVGTLFSMEKGLKAVGLESSSAGNMIFMLRKSLGGVSETGEPTSFIFQQLGLDMEKLKSMDAPTAIEAISQKLNKLDSSSAAAAAGKIFGRMNARDFLALARSSGEFAQAIKDSAKQAALFQRASGSFHAIEIGLEKVKGKAQGLFAGIAVGLAPAIQNVVDSLSGIDLASIGEQLGEVITAFSQAFKEGKLMDLVVDSFKLAFEAVVRMAPAILGKIGIFLIKMFETPLEYLQAGMEWAIQNIMEQMGKIPKLGKWLGLDGFKAESWNEIIKSRKESGAEFFTQGNTVNNMSQGVDMFYEQQKGELAKRAGEFMGTIHDFASRATKPKAGSTEQKGGEQLAAGYHMERTALEKMGFVFNGSAAGDPAKETAKNTAKTANLLEKLLNKAGSGGGGDDFLTNQSVA